MPPIPWFRLPRETIEREQSRLLAEWLTREVVTFAPFWRERLAGRRLRGIDDALSLPVVTEAQIAGAGGPGNPALVLSPTETQFKRHASRQELAEAARQAGGRGASGRRQAIWHRYKPVHVHEAGVDRLLAIAYTRSDLDRLHLAGARLAEVLGLGAEDALLNLVPAGPSIRFWGLYHAALASRMTALHPRSNGEEAVTAGRRGLAMLPASVVAVPSHEAARAIDELASLRVPAPNLRLILPIGPPPTAAERITLTELGERLAGRPVRVQAAWAPECSRVLYGEAPVAANDPPEATYGLLTYPDMEWLSVRDPALGDGDVADGAPGELVLSSIGWRGTALVRVATGSWVAGLERGRPHPVTGATVPRIAPEVADGAWQPRVRTADGLRRPDLRPARRLVERAIARTAVSDWWLGQADGVLVLAVDAPRLAEEAIEALSREIGGACGVVPEVVVNPVLARRRPQVAGAGPLRGG